MVKKVLKLLLIAVILIPVNTVGAIGKQDKTIKYPGYNIVTEEMERKIELFNQHVERDYVDQGTLFYPTNEQKKMMELKKYKTNGDSLDVVIMGEVYEDGTTKVVEIVPYSNGNLVQEDNVKGVAKNVWDIGTYIAGIFFDTVGGILLDIISYHTDTIDKSKGSDTYTFSSYRYIGKDVLVYDTDRWELWYQAKSREIYAHTLSTYVNQSGSTRTKSFDYTIDNGYSPVKTEYSKNYNNDSELVHRGWYNWYKEYNAYRYPEYGY